MLHSLAVILPLLVLIPLQDYGRRDTGFRIEVSPRSDYPPGYNADFETTEIYPCAGYAIRSGITWQKDTLTIRIDGWVRPSPCIPLSSRATGSLYLGDIGDGEYLLRIRYRGDEDRYRLVRKDGAVTVTGLSPGFTTLEWNNE